jgi:hypothetical protein
VARKRIDGYSRVSRISGRAGDGYISPEVQRNQIDTDGLDLTSTRAMEQRTTHRRNARPRDELISDAELDALQRSPRRAAVSLG